ncbi:MAG TPA: hypothetical protein VMW16_05120 [Sedimentisphaerales bacterium]|nr:hypothetical protein [Sedimentisphaerales bacterium]
MHRLDDIQKPQNVHFIHNGYEVLGRHVAVKVHADGETHKIGYFTGEIEAAKVGDCPPAGEKAAKIYHGESATLNFEP